MRPAETVTPQFVPIEELDRDILNLCRSINAATYELLTLIRQFDERVGWCKWGLSSCTEWLAWRCDLSMATAREKVRVAHALKALPLIAESFSTGELSYTKVRALTRVANTENEKDLVAFALRNTASYVAQRCRELRMGSADSIDTAARANAGRSLRIRRDPDRGTMTLIIDLPLESGDVVDKALEKARDDDCPGIPEVADTPWSKRQADAFVRMAREYLNSDARECKQGSDNYLLTVHVDQSALAGAVGRSSLPIESVRRLCCDSSAVVITEDDTGQPLSIGRKSRIIPKAIQRAVRARDNDCCTFPGCENRRYLDCHHVEHWSNGGETALENLMLLCTKHHTLVHEGGFRIERDFQNRWYVVRPDGVAVPTVGYRSQDMIDEDIGDADYDPPAGGFLSVAEKLVSEPDPPVYFH
ncbi:MAG: DUF222 domain-containing protein [Woeseiaceae bacterium]